MMIRKRLWAALAALILAPSVLAQATSQVPRVPEPFGPETKKAVLERVDQIVRTVAYVPAVDFSKWPEYVTKHKGDIDKASTPDEFARAINGALREFGFSHIVFSTPTAAQARLERKIVGIGVSLQPEEGGLRVMATFPKAPAEEAGIAAGDLIMTANGKKVESPAQIGGDEGTVVTLKVMKADGKEKTYKITRRKFSTARPETLTWPNEATAVLKVPSFDLGYDRKRVEGLMQEAAKAKNLILDLRSNGGGAVVNLTHLMGLLMPPGTPLGTFIGRNMVDQYTKETGGTADQVLEIAKWAKNKLRATRNEVPYFKGNIAVLINGGSGSASEIAASALQDNFEAPVVGSKSAGAVLVSVMSMLPGGFQLQYPINDYVTVSGYRIEGRGVLPILEAAMPTKVNDPDPGVERAVSLLQRIARLRENGGK